MSGRRLIYILDRFPADTLNFIYNEIRVLEEEGWAVELYSLLPALNCPEEARHLLSRTTNVRPVSAWRLLTACFHYLLRRPLAFLALLAIPFDNDRPTKVLKSFVHLAHSIRFARMIEGKSEHVHAHFAFKAALAGLVASRLNGNGFSFTAHGSAAIHAPDRYCLRSKLKEARFVVAVSEYNKRRLLDFAPDLAADKIVISRCGILPGQFEQQSRESGSERETDGGTEKQQENGQDKGLESSSVSSLERGAREPLRMLCVASLYPIKNHEGLLAACALLKQRGVAFTLGLIGKDEGGRRAALESLAAELGVAGSVRFHGVVDHGEIARHLRQADLFVLASHSEGIPVSVMEAMAMGTPVLAPRITGLPELVEEGVSGLLADPKRPGEFADAMRRVADDPAAAAAMADAAREKVAADFDLEANARHLADLFAKLTA